MIAAAALVALSSRYLGQDLWYDEFTSLDWFALKGFSFTATTYSQPNNHIFFNLYQAAITGIFGGDIYDWMDRVIPLRVLQLAFGGLAVAFTFKFAHEFLDRVSAYISMIVLVTTIPFVNFVTQLRGYGFGILFAIGMMYFAWGYTRDRRILQLALMILFGFCLLYTIPSHVYFVVSLGALWTFRWIAALRRERGKKPFRGGELGGDEGPESRVILRLLMGIAGSVALTVLAYLPVLKTMMNDPVVTRDPPYRAYVLAERLPAALYHFLSARYLLALLFLGGLVGLGTLIRRQGSRGNPLPIFYQLLFLLFCPFLVSFLTNSYPFERSFVSLAPVFALVIAAPVARLVMDLQLMPKKENLLVAGVYAYCVANAFWQMNVVQDRLDENLARNKRAQDIYHNYYLADNYTPVRSTALLADQEARSSGPIVILDPFDRMSIFYYLKRQRLESFALRETLKWPNRIEGVTYSHLLMIEIADPNPSEKRFGLAQVPVNLADYPEKEFGPLLQVATGLRNGPAVFVITAYADKFQALFDRYYADVYRCEKLNHYTSSTNVFMLTKLATSS